MKKLLLTLGLALSLTLPGIALAQVQNQNTIITTPFGGFVYSPNTTPTSKLAATSSPFFSSFSFVTANGTTICLSGDCKSAWPSGGGSFSTTSSDYWLTTKTTADLLENTNLYFTSARVLGTLLTGFVSGAGTVAATDTVLQAIQKLNGNLVAFMANAYPFPLTGNATSTLTQFNGGLTAYATSTIGDGTQGGGLTVSGGATTTGIAYFASRIGVGIMSPVSTLLGQFESTTGNATVKIDSTVSTALSRVQLVNDAAKIISYSVNGSATGNTGPTNIPSSGLIQSTGVGGLVLNTSDAAANMVFTTGGITNANERMRILPGGNIGIGTIAPATKLDVQGSASSTDSYVASLISAAGTFVAADPTGKLIATTSPAGSTYTATYPVTLTGSAFGLAFGTTTANTWSLAQTFTTVPVFSTVGAGTVNSTAGGTFYNTTTSTPTVSAPITYSGTLGSFISGISGAFGCTNASAGVTGCLTGTDWSTFNGKQAAGNYITALTGDVTASGPGSVATTLATVNGNVGSFTNANITVNAKGLITAAANGAAAGASVGTVATSAPETAGQVAIFSTTSGYPARLYSVPTTTQSFSGPFTIGGTIGSLIGGSNSTITWNGLATTTQPASSNILVSNGGAGVYGVATSTLTASGPLTGSFTQIGSGGALGCTTASSGVAGCLSNTAFDTFNGKENVLAFTWPLIRSTNTITFGGLSTSTAAVVGNIPYFSGVNTFANVATSSLAVSSSFSYSGTLGALVGGANGTLSIANNGVTSAMLANADFGNFTCATGVCTIDNLSVTNAMIAANTIDLTAKVTGVLPIANGGTNANTFGTTNGITAFDGTRLVDFSAYTLTSSLFTAGNSSTTLASFNYASSTLGFFGTLTIPNLGTAAGSFLAVDPNGKIIATTTPAGGGGSPGGSATEIQYRAGASTFGAVANSAYSSILNSVSFGSGTFQTNAASLTIASSTGSVVRLIGSSAIQGWDFRVNPSGSFILASSSPTIGATSTQTAFSIQNGIYGPEVGIGTDNPMGTLHLFSTNGTGCDPSIYLSGNSGVGDTDFSICRTSNNDAVDNDKFQIGRGDPLSISSPFLPYLTIDNIGRVGIGSTTPFALFAIASSTFTNYKIPLFSVSTSSDSAGQLFSIFATSTTPGSIFPNDFTGVRAVVGNIINSFTSLFINGTIDSSWQNLSCDPFYAPVNGSTIIADQNYICGFLSFDEGSNSQLNPELNINDLNGTSMSPLSAVIADSAALRIERNDAATLGTSTPKMEVIIGDLENVSSTTAFYIGWINTAQNNIAAPTNGCFIAATSTATWQAVCLNSGAGLVSQINTGIATSSTVTKWHMELTPSNFLVYAKNSVYAPLSMVASINTSIPTTGALYSSIYMLRNSGGIAIAPKFDIYSVKFWAQNAWGRLQLP